MTLTGDEIGTIQDKTETEVHKLTRDWDYKPRYSKVYARYNVKDDDFLNGDGYAVELLLKKSMINGSKTGGMKIFARGEGFFNDYFSCKKTR